MLIKDSPNWILLCLTFIVALLYRALLMVTTAFSYQPFCSRFKPLRDPMGDDVSYGKKGGDANGENIKVTCTRFSASKA